MKQEQQEREALDRASEAFDSLENEIHQLFTDEVLEDKRYAKLLDLFFKAKLRTREHREALQHQREQLEKEFYNKLFKISLSSNPQDYINGVGELMKEYTHKEESDAK